jgi:hypothetical protein
MTVAQYDSDYYPPALPQQFGLLQGEPIRLDERTRVQLGEARIAGARKQLNAADDQIAAFAGAGDDARLAQAIAQKKTIQAQMPALYTRTYGGQVLSAIKQAQQDNLDVAAGKTGYPQLGPDRTYHALAMFGHDPIQFVPDFDHNGDGKPDGVSPMQQTLGGIHDAMQTGDYRTAQQKAFEALHPYLSPHSPGEALHFAGYRAPYPGDPGDPHAHIGQAHDIIGALGTVQAAVAGDAAPGGLQDLLKRGYANGGSGRVQMAGNILKQSGGTRGLATQLAQPDETERRYMLLQGQLESSYVAAGMKPDQAQAKARRQAIERIARDPVDSGNLGARTQITPAQVSAVAARSNGATAQNADPYVIGHIYPGKDGRQAQYLGGGRWGAP